ncbi:3-methyladenine DNA glycosylase AlkD [Methanohalophilus levihalophilus]|uniref:DNA alkylation repair protein n=1 Tax=Methanohalophilus levihalophilus TaxID=1431282 RepID=UPI001AE1C90A|nr:DNA alkylation repair protein [Methanohalophilus levihalophilus]MBP2030398.1 3-methyladenine DNA glycosylase AlkD [Methanohalophilus levihalophilus]
MGFSSVEKVIEYLESHSRPEAVEGMQKFGITPDHAYGVSIPDLRALAKSIGRDHYLALSLWEKDTRETRILASMIEEVGEVTEEQVDRWVEDFDYWEICDQCCMNLFEKTPFAKQKALEWSSRDEEYVKRAGFVLMARLAVSNKKAEDDYFAEFFPIIEREATDERNMVKKAVNWALRQIGKRNLALNKRAVECAEKVAEIESKSAKWIASDALRELKSEKVIQRLEQKAVK